MSNLIERLRYKYADILHLEAAAELEACAISNKLKDFVADTRGAEIERLTAENKALTESGWRSCIDHIIRPDSPCPVCGIERLTSDNEMLRDELEQQYARAEALRAALRIVPGFVTNRARADFVKDTLAATERGDSDG